jgi:hypothetical protein
MHGNFARTSGLSWLWRQKMRLFAQSLDVHSRGLNMAGLTGLLGRGWAFKYRAKISSIDLVASGVTYPDLFTAVLDQIAFRGERPPAPVGADAEAQFAAAERVGAILPPCPPRGVRPLPLVLVGRHSSPDDPFKPPGHGAG